MADKQNYRISVIVEEYIPELGIEKIYQRTTMRALTLEDMIEKYTDMQNTMMEE